MSEVEDEAAAEYRRLFQHRRMEPRACQPRFVHVHDQAGRSRA
jgi:hypothetical protein